MEFREATLNDIVDLAHLMEQLGYPTSIESMRKRMTIIETTPNYRTLVALYNGRIAGMIGLVKGLYYEMDGCYVRIVALVVDSNYRKKSIGTMLLKEAEKWAKNIGATGIGLNSGNRPERMDAHAFYKSNGFIEKSIGFAKSFV